MAQLDITGFVTPEQDLKGLNELTNTLAAQNAAKAKAALDAAKATKKSQLEVKLNPADYATGTIYDPYMDGRMLDIKEEGIKYAQEHPDATQLDMDSHLMPFIRKASEDAEKLKVLKRQRDEGLEYIKKIPGADPVLFDKEFDIKGFKRNPDGTLPKDLSGIDINTNYVSDIIENSPIWNNGAVDNLVAKAGSGKSTEAISVKEANKGSRATEIDIESPLHMKPVLDKDGHFAYDFEMPNVLYTEKGQVKQFPVIDETTGLEKKDVQGNPVTEPRKMLTTDDWETVKNDFPTRKLIEQEVKRRGKDPNTTEGEMEARAIGFQLINASSKAKTRFSEKVKQVAPPAPVIKNVINTGTTKNTAPTINDVYSRLKKLVDEKMELHKNNPKKYKDYQQINTLPSDIRKIVLAEARDATGISDLGVGSIKIKLDNNGTMGIYNADDNSLITQLSEQGVNVSASVGTKNKNAVISNMKYKTNNGKTYTHAQLIKMGYTDETIEQAKQAGNLKNN